MARVNITVADDVLDRARAAGLNVSRVATAALCEALDRRAKAAALDDYLQQLELEVGPISDDERAAAAHWADGAVGESARPTADRSSRAG